MKIRITAKQNEIELIEKALLTIGNITYMSKPYAQTRNSKYNENVAVYIESAEWHNKTNEIKNLSQSRLA